LTRTFILSKFFGKEAGSRWEGPYGSPMPWGHGVDFMSVFLYNAFDEKNETICCKRASYIKTKIKRGGLK
jgi:hypothetical protein